jgi:hypothetical protein
MPSSPRPLATAAAAAVVIGGWLLAAHLLYKLCRGLDDVRTGLVSTRACSLQWCSLEFEYLLYELVFIYALTPAHQCSSCSHAGGAREQHFCPTYALRPVACLSVQTLSLPHTRTCCSDSCIVDTPSSPSSCAAPTKSVCTCAFVATLTFWMCAICMCVFVALGHAQQECVATVRLLKKKVSYVLPKYIILVRHGESLGNVDEEAYRCVRAEDELQGWMSTVVALYCNRNSWWDSV